MAKEYLGKTVEDAIEEGLKDLGLTRENAEITVLEEPVKGLFKSKKAKVAVEAKKTPGEKAVAFLDGLFDKMGQTVAVQLKKEDEKIEIELVSQNSAFLIGYRGEMLDSLQNLAGAVANTGNAVYQRVVVDCEGYRAKREATLINLAKNLEKKAVRTGRDVKLEPMSAFERRLVHSTLANSENVTTTSDGKEPNRYVIIVPNVKKPYTPRKDGYKKDFKGGRNGNFKKYDNRPSGSSAPRKKTITFGTYLGNSGAKKDEQ